MNEKHIDYLIKKRLKIQEEYDHAISMLGCGEQYKDQCLEYRKQIEAIDKLIICATQEDQTAYLDGKTDGFYHVLEGMEELEKKGKKLVRSEIKQAIKNTLKIVEGLRYKPKN